MNENHTHTLNRDLHTKKYNTLPSSIYAI